VVNRLVSCCAVGGARYLEEDLCGVVLEVDSLCFFKNLNLELVLEVRLLKVKLEHCQNCWLAEVEADFIYKTPFLRYLTHLLVLADQVGAFTKACGAFLRVFA
jgi:hypothetical protein